MSNCYSVCTFTITCTGIVTAQVHDKRKDSSFEPPHHIRTHAKDGNRLATGNPEYIYGVEHLVPEEFKGVRYFEEVPLGTGGVDFKAYLEALEEIGCRGYLTIEREIGGNPKKEVCDIESSAIGTIRYKNGASTLLECSYTLHSGGTENNRHVLCYRNTVFLVMLNLQGR